MARPDSGIRVDGLVALQKALRSAPPELRKELRLANKAAAQVVATAAKPLAPKRTGRLAASIGARAGQRDASVKAGSASRVPYAGPIHFGWPARGIRPQPFLYKALDRRQNEVRARYEDAINTFSARF